MSRQPHVRHDELDLDDLFPTKGAIPESQQIGRAEAITEVAERLVAGEDILTAEPRRVGKSSTIGFGALPLIQRDFGGVVASVDLRQAGIRDAQSLAEAVVKAAMASGAGVAVQKEQAKRIARITQRLAGGERAKAAASLAGDGTKTQAVQAVATLIAGGGTGVQQFRKVLAALEMEAANHERPVVVFIDEVQDLGARWADPEEGLAVQRELERMMRTPGRLVTYAFAGSERESLAELFADGQPLHFEGTRYRLPAIGDSAWRQGITERFARDLRSIKSQQIDEILAFTGGHPLRTMQVCRQALRIARRQAADAIGSEIVAEALAQAKEHPSWREAEE
jgi:hypothetical protein